MTPRAAGQGAVCGGGAVHGPMFPRRTATLWHRVKGLAQSLSAIKQQNEDLNLGVLI